jgi:hypothetical protein
MAKESLVIYLQDHLAGSAGAVEILEALRDVHPGETLGQFPADILAEVQHDRATLRDLAEGMGGGTGLLKDATAWLGVKLSRFKLGCDLSGDLGTLDALEVVALGILGKQSLWDLLRVVSATDARLSGLDLAHLSDRARTQHARVEERRLEVGRQALA